MQVQNTLNQWWDSIF